MWAGIGIHDPPPLSAGWVFPSRARQGDDRLQRSHEIRPHAAQLVPVRQGKARKQALTLRCHLDQDLAPVDVAATPCRKSPLDQAIRQLHGAVMANLQAFGERADRGPPPLGKSFDGEQELVLPGLDTGGPRLAFAEREEAADLVAKLGQSLVVDLGNHIVKRYNAPGPAFGTSFLPSDESPSRARTAVLNPDVDHSERGFALGLCRAPGYARLTMRKIVGIGFTMAFFACSSSSSNDPADAGGDASADTGKADGPVAPDAAKNDLPANPGDAADVGLDLRADEATNGPDGPAHDVAAAPADAVDGGGDTPPKPELPAVDRGGNDTNDGIDATITDVASIDVTVIDANAPATDSAVASDLGEQCSCGDTQTSGPSAVSWGCFCSVESCTRTLADFVDSGDGGRVLKPGHESVLLLDYAGCNRILVQAYTYSRYVPASEYVFDRTTGALVGAKVWLDDRQHACPFPASGARWVFGYQSGSYPIPSACQATDCVPGSGPCPGTPDAQ
jgi:hypothetical protein